MALLGGSGAVAPARMRPVAELTVRGMILGALMTAVFTAANVFFGLKAGLTFNSSIPATVISMALLRGFKSASIQENNIVQTIASSAGTLSSIIFVLPGLVMIGWWTGFPYWQSFAVCALGGVLGVMYSIPLRRALVTESDLPYPEGVACAEVLRVGARHEGDGDAPAEGRAGLLTVVVGGLVSAAFAVAIAMRLLASDVVKYARFGRSATGFDLGMSMALFGVGHLVGLWVGLAMLLGLAIGWGAAVPTLTALHATPGLAQAAAEQVWSHDVRFIGAGAIGVAAVWTLLKLVGPVAGGLRSALAASRARRGGQGGALPIVERDIPINIVGLVCLASLVPIAWLLVGFARQGGLGATAWTLAIGGVIFVVLVGFLVSAVCGYMAGLIGSSNSPLSGVGILAIIGASLLLVAEAHGASGPRAIHALTAFALFVTAIVFAIAAIANDNLQDLKTGQLVGATPWKQQAALVFGVLMGAAVIPPILDLLNHAYGFVGAPGAVVGRALAAPQAGLISALARGVLGGEIDWSLIGIGIAIGAVVIVLDEGLRRAGRPRLPPLAVGLGVYLPMAVTLMVVVGAVVGHIYERRIERRPGAEQAKQLGVLLASGLIVGESLIGVVLAALVVGLRNPTPLAVVGDSFQGAAIALSVAVFAVALFLLYRWIARMAETAAPAT
ncbi:MAG TPA: oligopeptide transporter, OPT family [Caulobacteraceae bacterium]|nr:oligopeptide transporter, OPT family [Caulobacteraceae bacterium]